ncbi:MAG: PhzF family phenazine biosynthesis protein [Betaproteobacteria bacterium]
MQERHFQQVDVFTATPYLGNPVAVVLQGAGLSDAAMQQFARWTNLSETTFVLAPTDALADYHLRIFTPGGEMQFAGHPTLGSCHAWLKAGGQPKSKDFVVQQCGVGLVRIRREAGMLAFGAPPLQRSDASAQLLGSVAAALGIKPAQVVSAQLLDNGTPWLGLLLDNPQTVQQLRPDFARLKGVGHKVGVAAVHVGQRAGSDAPDLEVRGFAPHMGIDEDPVTGSLNASLAQWLIADGHMPSRYVAAQGAALGRAGRVMLSIDAAAQVWVGGLAVTCIEGKVRL